MVADQRRERVEIAVEIGDASADVQKVGSVVLDGRIHRAGIVRRDTEDHVPGTFDQPARAMDAPVGDAVVLDQRSGRAAARGEGEKGKEEEEAGHEWLVFGTVRTSKVAWRKPGLHGGLATKNSWPSPK